MVTLTHMHIIYGHSSASWEDGCWEETPRQQMIVRNTPEFSSSKQGYFFVSKQIVMFPGQFNQE